MNLALRRGMGDVTAQNFASHCGTSYFSGSPCDVFAKSNGLAPAQEPGILDRLFCWWNPDQCQSAVLPKPAPPSVPPGALTPGPGLGPTGSVDPETLINSTIDPSAAIDRQNLQDYLTQQADIAAALNAPTCGTFTTLNTATNNCDFDPAKPSFLILVAIGIGALLILKKGKLL